MPVRSASAAPRLPSGSEGPTRSSSRPARSRARRPRPRRVPWPPRRRGARPARPPARCSASSTRPGRGVVGDDSRPGSCSPGRLAGAGSGGPRGSREARQDAALAARPSPLSHRARIHAYGRRAAVVAVGLGDDPPRPGRGPPRPRSRSSWTSVARLPRLVAQDAGPHLRRGGAPVGRPRAVPTPAAAGPRPGRTGPGGRAGPGVACVGGHGEAEPREAAPHRAAAPARAPGSCALGDQAMDRVPSR